MKNRSLLPHFLLPLALAIGGILPMKNSSAQTSSGGESGVEAQTYTYKIGAEEFEGYLARPAKSAGGGATGSLPGVLVVHDWTGCGPFAKARAEQLAKLGYVALALDMYGKGQRATPGDSGSAAALAKPFYTNFSLFRERAQPALAELLKQPGVDPKRVGAIGFCFGGTTVLELARSGADLQGVVSFHGGLKTPNTADAKSVKAQLLVLHGALDPMVPPSEVAGFMDEMNKAGVPYKLVAYPKSVHAFTNPDAGSDLSKPTAYNPQSAEAAYAEMRRFFGEIFAGAPAPAAR